MVSRASGNPLREIPYTLSDIDLPKIPVGRPSLFLGKILCHAQKRILGLGNKLYKVSSRITETNLSLA